MTTAIQINKVIFQLKIPMSHNYLSVIYWSQHITSDSIIPVMQQIMDHQNIFTLWEKTAMFYGHFKVVYFTH